MGNNIKVRDFMLSFYNETPETFKGRGHGILGSFEDSELTKNGGGSSGGGSSTGDGYSKEEIDGLIKGLSERITKNTKDIESNKIELVEITDEQVNGWIDNFDKKTEV